MHYNSARYVEFPQIMESRGKLTYVEGERTVPFSVKRIYYIYDIPDSNAKRGGHAHRGVQEVMIPIAGQFEVTCDNGVEKTHFHMVKRNVGLYVPEMVWADLFNFSKNAICLVLSSEYYDEVNYVRKYSDFIQEIKKMKKGDKS